MLHLTLLASVGEPTFLSSAIAGGVAAASATVIFHPVDTLKTVLQDRGSSSAGRGMHAVRNALSSVGARGLYRGVLPAAFSMMPACAVRMGAYETFKTHLLERDWPVPPPVLIASASALSVVVSASVRAPLDMVKVQVQAGSSPSAIAALRTVASAGGLRSFRALYRGAGLTLLRDVPFFSINLLLYEQLKTAAVARRRRTSSLEDALSRSTLLPSEAILLGAIAQGVAGFSTNPVDRLKTIVQAGAAPGVKGALASVLKAEGVMGLMRGAGMRTIWIMPQGCIYYPLYELVQRTLNERRAPCDTSPERLIE
uniref:Mitochondrial carrier protein n=1 Tax=Coccolithus braarudii TaxID=221442 RepID=A0A7S0LDU2_9EUKA